MFRQIRDFFFHPTVNDLEKLDRVHLETEELKAVLCEIRQFSQHSAHFATEQFKTAKLVSLGPERIIEFAHNGMIPIKFFVPKGGIDFIQSFQLTYETFYEREILESFNEFLCGKAILDIGANVGNHVVYWSKVSRAKSIKAYEPIPELFGILRRNVEINEVKNVELFNIALGPESGFGMPVSDPANRMQSEVHKGEGTDGIKIAALDDLGIEEADFAKIDVEGFTFGVLEGAKKTLSRFKPMIFVEIFDKDKPDCFKLLSELGYEKVKDFPDSNYLFVHKDRPFSGDLP